MYVARNNFFQNVQPPSEFSFNVFCTTKFRVITNCMPTDIKTNDVWDNICISIIKYMSMLGKPQGLWVPFLKQAQYELH